MFNEPLPFTVNCVVKLNPEASPVPPCKAALQIPLAAFCVVGVLLLPQTVKRERDQQQNCNFFHEISLSLDSDPKMYGARFWPAIF